MTHAPDSDAESVPLAIMNPAGTTATSVGSAAHTSPGGSFQYVLCIRGRVDESNLPSFIRTSLREIRTHIEATHIEVVGAPFVVSRPASQGRMDVEVGWPVRNASDSGRVHAGALPISMIRPEG
jgi:hypothetical protein